MRKRIFTMIPLVALLASCGSAPDPLAAVAKQLPNDVTPVSKTSEEEQETYSRALNKVMEGITTFDFSKSVYELSLGLNVSVSGSYQGVAFSGSVGLSGGVKVGFDQYKESEETYSRMFMSVDNLSLSANINLPSAMLEKMPFTFPTSMSYGLKFAEYIEETPSGTFVYADYSDHGLQDIIAGVVGLNVTEQSKIDEALDNILGTKDGSGYRPGYAKINLSSILPEIYQDMTNNALPPAIANKPISYAMDMMGNSIEEFLSKAGDMLPAIVEIVNPYVGVQYNGNELDKVTAVFNVNVASLIQQAGGDPSSVPVSGVFGLLVSVGTDHGSSVPVLETLELSANMSVATENFTVGLNGNLAFNAYFGSQANVKHVENPSSYVDVTSVITDLMHSKGSEEI